MFTIAEGILCVIGVLKGGSPTESEIYVFIAVHSDEVACVVGIGFGWVYL